MTPAEKHLLGFLRRYKLRGVRSVSARFLSAKINATERVTLGMLYDLRDSGFVAMTTHGGWVAEDNPPKSAPQVKPPRAEVPRPKVTYLVARRRFKDHKPLDPDSVNGLPSAHHAVTDGRTLFPSTVVDPKDSPALFVSGENSRKLGGMVTKGPWAGFPIYQLTLEERATCPRSCSHWLTCYGNGMQMSRRHRHTDDLVPYLRAELVDLQHDYPNGFVIRLHVLGDFFSTEYVAAWARFLLEFPALHVFGYTAWPKESEIGAAIKSITDKRWDRFAIRFSSAQPQPQGATTIWRVPEDSTVWEGIVCPAQTGKTDCCGTCGLCWAGSAKEKTIAFVAHGRVGSKKKKPVLLPSSIPLPNRKQLMGGRA